MRSSVHTDESIRQLHKNWLSGKFLFLKEIFSPRHGPRLATRKSESSVELHAMKIAIALGLIILAPIGHAANAAPASNYSDLEVISVRPRTSSVKPFVMAIFTPEQRQRMAIFKRSALATKDSKLLRQ